MWIPPAVAGFGKAQGAHQLLALRIDDSKRPVDQRHDAPSVGLDQVGLIDAGLVSVGRRIRRRGTNAASSLSGPGHGFASHSGITRPSCATDLGGHGEIALQPNRAAAKPVRRYIVGSGLLELLQGFVTGIKFHQPECGSDLPDVRLRGTWAAATAGAERE
jgi:hypothetical protein